MADLNEYKRKRHFTSTNEPRGTVRKKRAKKLRFVVQHHIARRDHYDFRLEWDGTLKSWAVPKGPSYSSHDKRLAVQVEDHPLEYRKFEGTIPKGEYGGGVVMIWDEGSWLPMGNVDEGLAGGSLKFELEGSRLRGKWALVRMKMKPGEHNTNWLLIKERDEYEDAFVIDRFTTSVTTGRTMEEIKEGKGGDSMPARTENTDKAKSVKGEKALTLADFTLTNPGKILFSEGITKGDLAAYYLKVSSRMLPYLQKRILSAVRCPSGIEKPCFYKKHPVKDTRGLVRVSVAGSDDKSEEYYSIANIYGLMAEVQMNTLEFHVWGSSVDTLEQPDCMVFDLDPDEGMGLERIRQGVRDLKDMLDQLSLISYLKTSGGKGYHVVVPFKPAPDWDVFSTFAKNLAKAMEAMWPDRYTSNVRKTRRNNRIFIDWIRNGKGATSVAPYSVRARNGAPVSMPIGWKELDTVAPHDVSMENAIKRLRNKDPWNGFFDNNQRLT